jgi:hypothetical protein
MPEPEPEQAIIFTIGRMNPPTSGHMKVVQKLLEKAIEIRQRNVYILLSHTTGEQKNPLMCSEKKEFISSGMIDKIKEHTPGAEDIKVTLICGDDPVAAECDPNWITSKLCQIMLTNKYNKEQMIRLYLFIGEDRATSYEWLIKKYNKSDALTHLTINSEGLERPPGAMSGTDMRLLVTEGKEEEFIEKEMEAGLSRTKAAELYSRLAFYLSKPDTKKRKMTEKSTAKSSAKSTAKSTTKSQAKRAKTSSGGKRRKTKKGKKKGRKTKKRKYIR